jgi:hypothetical protein
VVFIISHIGEVLLRIFIDININPKDNNAKGNPDDPHDLRPDENRLVEDSGNLPPPPAQPDRKSVIGDHANPNTRFSHCDVGNLNIKVVSS